MNAPVHYILPEIDYGKSNFADVRKYFDPTGHDSTDWYQIRDALRFAHNPEVRAVRACLVAAFYKTDDTVLKTGIGALLDYHSEPQGAFEEEGGADAMRGHADTLRDAAELIDRIAEGMK